MLRSCSTETCRLCPDEARFIFQPLHSAASAPRTDIFTWMNYDLDGESAAAVQMRFPIKSSLQRLFFFSVLKQSYLITGAVFMPHKLAVIFHHRAHEGNSLTVSSIWEESQGRERHPAILYWHRTGIFLLAPSSPQLPFGCIFITVWHNWRNYFSYNAEEKISVPKNIKTFVHSASSNDCKTKNCLWIHFLLQRYSHSCE